MKLKYQICDFSKKSPSGKFFNKYSMQRILDSNDFKDRLRTHDLMGTISHKFRWDKETENKKNMQERNGYPALPHSDLMVENGTAANCCENVYIEGDSLIAELQVLDSMDLGKKIRDMIEIDKITPEVSMVVVEGDGPNNTIDILDFMGVDFTFLPALQSKLLATYSKTLDTYSKSNTYKNFMIEADEDQTRSNASEVSCYSKFLGVVDESVPAVVEDASGDMECYSIREFIRVRNRKPMQAIMMILNDVKNYIRSTKPELLEQVKGLVIEYVTSYLFKKITEVLTDKNTKFVNLNLLLGLNRFCSSQAMSEFQRVANYVLRQKISLGYLDKRSQTMLAEATSKLVGSIIDWILRGMPEDKQVIFDPSKKVEVPQSGGK